MYSTITKTQVFVRLHRIDDGVHLSNGEPNCFPIMVNVSSLDMYYDNGIWINGTYFEVKETMKEISKLISNN